MNPLENQIIEKLISFAKKRMTRLNSSHGWDHVERIINIAEKIIPTESKANPFIVKTSAILHDIARIDETDEGGKKCHAHEGSIIAYNFLIENGLDAERSEHIKRCILTHRYRNSLAPETIEAKILYDADKLDSIGAVGVGRAFLFSGEIGARLHNPGIDIDLTKAYSKEDTAYREYMVKLRFIKDRMLTNKGRHLAEERHRFMGEFFKRIQDEVRGIL